MKMLFLLLTCSLALAETTLTLKSTVINVQDDILSLLENKKICTSTLPQDDIIPDFTFMDNEWRKRGFLSTEKYNYLGEEETHASHVLPLSFVVLKNSHWDQADLLEEIKTLKNFYTQCGIQLDIEIYFTSLLEPVSGIYYSPENQEINSRNKLGSKTPIEDRVGVYFFDSFIDNPLQNGTSSPLGVNGEDCPYLDYSWMSYQGRVKGGRSRFTLAHEMTHNLANVGHGPDLAREKNLKSYSHYRDCNDRNNYLCPPSAEREESKIMNSNPFSRDESISDQLCLRIKSHPKVLPLSN